jgi:hypothetical protein
MALGYEGYIQIDGSYVMGTGTSVPRTRRRIDSSGAYHGAITGANIGVGLPHTYDWEVFDGSAEFEVSDAICASLKSWIVTNRDTSKEISFSSRNTNEQVFNGYWRSISFSASQGSIVTGSLGFSAMGRDTYVYGSDTPAKNPADNNLQPIPYWDTAIGAYKFIDWNLAFTQDVVKFFACKNNTNPVEPAYIGVGPVDIAFSGSYMFDSEMPDTIASLAVQIGSTTFTLSKNQLQDISDNVQTHNNLTPITVTLACYGVS